METDARKRARAAYRARNQVEALKLELPQGTKERWKAAAAAAGKSLTAYISGLIDADLSEAEQRGGVSND